MARTKKQQEQFDRAEAEARKTLVEVPQQESEETKRTPAQQAAFDAAEAKNREAYALPPQDGDTKLEVQSVISKSKAQEVK